MAIGPVQLHRAGLHPPRLPRRDHRRAGAAALKRHGSRDRLAGRLQGRERRAEVEHLSNLSEHEAIELGTKIGALIGLGIEGEEGIEAGAVAGAEEAADEGINVFAERRSGTFSTTSRTTPRPRSSCSSTTGPCRCGTRSRARAASVSATGSSARSTSSRSGSCRPRRPRNCTTWRPPARPGNDDDQQTPKGGMRCSDHAESPDGPGGAPPAASPAAACRSAGPVPASSAPAGRSRTSTRAASGPSVSRARSTVPSAAGEHR